MSLPGAGDAPSVQIASRFGPTVRPLVKSSRSPARRARPAAIVSQGRGARRVLQRRPLVRRVPAPRGGVFFPPGPPPDATGRAIAERQPRFV